MNPESPLRSSSNVLAAAIAIGCVLLTACCLAWFRANLIAGNAVIVEQENRALQSAYGEFYPVTENPLQGTHGSAEAESAPHSHGTIRTASVSRSTATSDDTHTARSSGGYQSVVYPNRQSHAAAGSSDVSNHPQVSVPVTINVNNGEILSELFHVQQEIQDLRRQQNHGDISETPASSRHKRFSYEVHESSSSHDASSTVSQIPERMKKARANEEKTDEPSSFKSPETTEDSFPLFPPQSSAAHETLNEDHRRGSEEARCEIVRMSHEVFEEVDVHQTSQKSAETLSVRKASQQVSKVQQVEEPKPRPQRVSDSERRSTDTNRRNMTSSPVASKSPVASNRGPLIPVELPDFFESPETQSGSERSRKVEVSRADASAARNSTVSRVSFDEEVDLEFSEFEAEEAAMHAESLDSSPVLEMPADEALFDSPPQSVPEIEFSELDKEFTQEQAAPDVPVQPGFENVAEAELWEVQPVEVHSVELEPVEVTLDESPVMEFSYPENPRLTPELRKAFAELRNKPPENLFPEESAGQLAESSASDPGGLSPSEKPQHTESISDASSSPDGNFSPNASVSIVSQSADLKSRESSERRALPRVAVGVDARSEATSETSPSAERVPFEHRYRFPGSSRPKAETESTARPSIAAGGSGAQQETGRPPQDRASLLRRLARIPGLREKQATDKPNAMTQTRPPVAPVPPVISAPIAPPVPPVPPVPPTSSPSAVVDSQRIPVLPPSETVASNETTHDHSAHDHSQSAKFAEGSLDNPVVDRPHTMPLAPLTAVPPAPELSVDDIERLEIPAFQEPLRFAYQEDSDSGVSDQSIAHDSAVRSESEATPALRSSPQPDTKFMQPYQPAWPGPSEIVMERPMQSDSSERVRNFQRAMEARSKPSMASSRGTVESHRPGTPPNQSTQNKRSFFSTTVQRVNKRIAAITQRTPASDSVAEHSPYSEFYSAPHSSDGSHARRTPWTAPGSLANFRLPEVALPHVHLPTIPESHVYTAHWGVCPPDIDPVNAVRNSTTLHRVISTVQFAGQSKVVK